jgi:hypothetical protein
MATYVTSLNPRASVAHIGYPVTACGNVFVGAHRTSAAMPANRSICRKCVSRASAYGLITDREAAILLWIQPANADSLVPLLLEGRSDREIALRLGVATRTLSRYIADAMARVGARTRFQWGYLVGLAASRS